MLTPLLPRNFPSHSQAFGWLREGKFRSNHIKKTVYYHTETSKEVKTSPQNRPRLQNSILYYGGRGRPRSGCISVQCGVRVIFSGYLVRGIASKSI